LLSESEKLLSRLLDTDMLLLTSPRSEFSREVLRLESDGMLHGPKKFIWETSPSGELYSRRASFGEIVLGVFSDC
jgi:hypothetical protein